MRTRVLLVGLLLVLPVPARAALVTWTLTGVVTTVDSAFATYYSSVGVSPGTPFSATITFDSTAAYTPQGPGAGYFTDPVRSMSVSAGLYSMQLSTPVSSSINGGGVYLSVQGGPTQSNPGDPAFFVELVDTHPGFDGSFPVVPPIYTGTQRNFAWITGVRAFASNNFTVTYTVPEPVTLALAAAAGALLLARAARRTSP